MLKMKFQEIACFSYDDEHKFHLDESSLRYYYPPRLPADLNKGFDTFEQLNDSGDEHLDALLETITALEKDTGSKCEADIITWRGMMTKVQDEFLRISKQKELHQLIHSKIMTVPFDHMNGYSLSPKDITGRFWKFC